MGEHHRGVHLGQRRQQGGAGERHVGLLPHPHKPDAHQPAGLRGAGPLTPGPDGRTTDPSPLPVGLGHGLGHALPPLQDQHPPGRPPGAAHRLEGVGPAGRWWDPPPVPARHRPAAHHPGPCRRGDGHHEGREAGAGPGRCQLHGFDERCLDGKYPSRAVLRAGGPPRHVPGRLVGGGLPQGPNAVQRGGLGTPRPGGGSDRESEPGRRVPGEGGRAGRGMGAGRLGQPGVSAGRGQQRQEPAQAPVERRHGGRGPLQTRQPDHRALPVPAARQLPLLPGGGLAGPGRRRPRHARGPRRPGWRVRPLRGRWPPAPGLERLRLHDRG